MKKILIIVVTLMVLAIAGLLTYKDVYYNPGTYPFNVFRKSLSHGCFVINKRAFKKTKRIAKPMLLWAYN